MRDEAGDAYLAALKKGDGSHRGLFVAMVKEATLNLREIRAMAIGDYMRHVGVGPGTCEQCKGQKSVLQFDNSGGAHSMLEICPTCLAPFLARAATVQAQMDDRASEADRHRAAFTKAFE